MHLRSFGRYLGAQPLISNRFECIDEMTFGDMQHPEIGGRWAGVMRMRAGLWRGDI